MFQKVAIIGGGAAAATLVSELLERRTPRPLHLTWFAGSAQPGRGVAYGTPSERHLLNVRAASMGMFVSKPGGFLEYAQALDPTVKGSDFLPRRLYGDFLQSRVDAAIKNAPQFGHDINVMPFAAESLVPSPEGVAVGYGDEEAHVEAAVLAIGSLPPRPLAGVADAALASGRYVTDPWPYLAGVESDDRPLRVLVIGLGLTAVDVMLDLSARWPNAHFTALSRHGHLPEPHLAAASAPGDDGTDLVESMRDDPNVRGWLHRLREAAESADDWRTVVDGMRPYTQGLWNDLPASERARFLRHARWAWERARHRMPPQVARAVGKLEAACKLTRMRGRMQSVSLRMDGDLDVVRRETGKDTTVSETYDIVIQTVGLNTDTLRTEHTLMRQLVIDDLVTPDRMGLGLAAQPDGHLLDGNGKPRGNLFAIGSLLRGALWESTAIPEIRKQAQSVANMLTAK
ncbi:pyridine nucleotide-disulfide oxidoreductase [Luteibacter pinisoli]|uniref:Pyridine nucleotide-disulfide oxidoreductase n=1 Tax=Luteibacter pinisoli TaxID=2589080 RepID=A0A4Y5Z009_9GAMM|nr:FAD/NAD(P)-binding protein [Luteibacter pinisoli]QDE38394.1 pyridine nucleotide-disulfide oxidoreductase [Luteibacter pinisoli]